MIYADLYMLLNGVCDALVLCLTSLILRRRASKTRIAAGAALGGAFALLSLFIPRALSLVLSFPAAFLMVWVVFSFGGIRKYLSAVLVFYLDSFFLSGAVQFLSAWIGEKAGKTLSSVVLVACLSAALFAALLFDEILKRRAHLPPVKLKFSYCGAGYEVLAFPDTGNLLTDARSGLPVILLSAEVLPFLPVSPPFVNASTAAGKARLPLVCAGEITLDGKAVEALIAVCPEKCSFGGLPALLPAALL